MMPAGPFTDKSSLDTELHEKGPFDDLFLKSQRCKDLSQVRLVHPTHHREQSASIKPALDRQRRYIALDIRKFEIDLYWKRAAYFWTFIAAAFGAYFLMFNAGPM